MSPPFQRSVATRAFDCFMYAANDRQIIRKETLPRPGTVILFSFSSGTVRPLSVLPMVATLSSSM